MKTLSSSGSNLWRISRPHQHQRHLGAVGVAEGALARSARRSASQMAMIFAYTPRFDLGMIIWMLPRASRTAVPKSALVLERRHHAQQRGAGEALLHQDVAHRDQRRLLRPAPAPRASARPASWPARPGGWPCPRRGRGRCSPGRAAAAWSAPAPRRTRSHIRQTLTWWNTRYSSSRCIVVMPRKCVRCRSEMSTKSWTMPQRLARVQRLARPHRLQVLRDEEHRARVDGHRVLLAVDLRRPGRRSFVLLELLLELATTWRPSC